MLSDDENNADVIVIGAGISGLLAAEQLQRAGLKTLVLDKARGVGGRMATRRHETGSFDHGAQYFTARNTMFSSRVEQWQREGLIRVWSDGFALENGRVKTSQEPRWIGTRGMNTLAKSIAVDLDVRLTAKVLHVKWNDSRWAIRTESGTSLTARALVLTPPVPQSLDLLDAGEVILDKTIRPQLEAINYAPCLALLVKLDGPGLVPDPGGLWMSGEPVAWIADNSQKGLADADQASLTIHASPGFSLRNWDAGEETITRQMLDASSVYLGNEVLTTQLHRWRYSIPQTVYPERFLALQNPGPLVFAGDAFGGPRVEGAACSGIAAGQELVNIMHAEI